MMRSNHIWFFEIISYYKKKESQSIISSFSQIVSPWHLVLCDHVTISFHPTQFCLSSSSTPSFPTKATELMTIFALLKQPHKRFYVFSCTSGIFCFLFSHSFPNGHLRMNYDRSKVRKTVFVKGAEIPIRRQRRLRRRQEYKLYCLIWMRNQKVIL